MLHYLFGKINLLAFISNYEMGLEFFYRKKEFESCDRLF